MGSGPEVTGEAAGSSCAIEERQIGDISVVSVAGTVDMLTAPQLQEAISAAGQRPPKAVVVDLKAVEFLASAGMGVLMSAHDELTPSVRFVVVADGPVTSRPLKVVGIADVIDLYPTLDDALAALTN